MAKCNQLTSLPFKGLFLTDLFAYRKMYIRVCYIVLEWVGLERWLSSTRCWNASNTRRRWTSTVTWRVFAHNATTWYRPRTSTCSSTTPSSRRSSPATPRSRRAISSHIYSGWRASNRATRFPAWSWSSRSAFLMDVVTWLVNQSVNGTVMGVEKSRGNPCPPFTPSFRPVWAPGL